VATAEVKAVSVPYTLDLKFPFKYGEREVTSLTFPRRLKAKDFKGIAVSDIRFDDMARILARITGESSALIEELDGEDLMTAVGVVNSFLPSGLTTGQDG
jgi:hypothetical protein